MTHTNAQKPKLGFGFCDPSQGVANKRKSAVDRILQLLDSLPRQLDSADLDAFSTVKGLFNRSHRHDCYDWYRVWCQLGCPEFADCKKIALALTGLRNAVTERDKAWSSASIRKLRRLDAEVHLENYLTGEMSGDFDVIYALRLNPRHRLVTVGVTTKNVFEDVLEIHRLQDYPLGIHRAWLASKDSVDAARLAYELDAWALFNRSGVYMIDEEDLEKVLNAVVGDDLPEGYGEPDRTRVNA